MIHKLVWVHDLPDSLLTFFVTERDELCIADSSKAAIVRIDEDHYLISSFDDVWVIATKESEIIDMIDLLRTVRLLPNDYEPCAACAFDHEYEFAEAQAWHTANPSST